MCAQSASASASARSSFTSCFRRSRSNTVITLSAMNVWLGTWIARFTDPPAPAPITSKGNTSIVMSPVAPFGATADSRETRDGRRSSSPALVSDPDPARVSGATVPLLAAATRSAAVRVSWPAACRWNSRCDALSRRTPSLVRLYDAPRSVDMDVRRDEALASRSSPSPSWGGRRAIARHAQAGGRDPGARLRSERGGEGPERKSPSESSSGGRGEVSSEKPAPQPVLDSLRGARWGRTTPRPRWRGPRSFTCGSSRRRLASRLHHGSVRRRSRRRCARTPHAPSADDFVSCRQTRRSPVVNARAFALCSPSGDRRRPGTPRGGVRARPVVRDPRFATRDPRPDPPLARFPPTRRLTRRMRRAIRRNAPTRKPTRTLRTPRPRTTFRRRTTTPWISP